MELVGLKSALQGLEMSPCLLVERCLLLDLLHNYGEVCAPVCEQNLTSVPAFTAERGTVG
jgi:hypothetical protein